MAVQINMCSGVLILRPLVSHCQLIGPAIDPREGLLGGLHPGEVSGGHRDNSASPRQRLACSPESVLLHRAWGLQCLLREPREVPTSQTERAGSPGLPAQ